VAVWITGAAGMMRQRFVAESFKTFSYRYPLWHAAAVMIREHPLLGIGIGQYPPHAFVASGNDSGIPTMQSVLKTGPTLWCLAHNEYLQTAAELGLIGLFFDVAILISFLFIAIRAWSRMPASSRRVFLAAAICAVVAQCVDALANPGWRFIDVDPILWLMLGLAMAAAPRGSEERLTEPGHPIHIGARILH
jgi:O-antigen ligase